MYKLNAYTNIQDETWKGYEHALLNCEEMDGTVAVSIKAFTRSPLQADFGVGIDIEVDGIKNWMSFNRKNQVWCAPAFGTELKDIPDQTQGLIYKKDDDMFGVIMPVVSEHYRCVLLGNEKGAITAKLYSNIDNLNTCEGLAFVYAEGENPYKLLEKCTKVAVKVLNNGCRTREERRYPETLEYLGWCTWDAMQIRVNEEDLLKKCEEFKEKNIPVKWTMLDDMWGEVHDFYGVKYDSFEGMSYLEHSSKLYSFKADPIRFPNGLDGCISKMNEYGIKVGMWHPTFGFWMGIDPAGEIYRDYKDCLVQGEFGRWIHSYETDKAFKFYDAFHTYLRQCGAEFIKIDMQSMCEQNYKGMASIGESARSYHSAMEASVGKHFDNAMINCMGMSSEDMWNRTVSPISRCSGDFIPEDSSWFVSHIMQCAYNDLFQGQLYYCDWDMWWSDDGQATKNTLMRAISGGPIYVSDKLERSIPENIMPLVLSDGRILRCDRPAMPTADCIVVDPTKTGSIFKIQNVCGDSGVIAAFNFDEEKRVVKGTISPAEIDGLEGEEFAVYEHFSRDLKIVKKDESFEVSLKDIDDYRLYIVVPVIDGFAPIGRVDKFISPKTIKYVHGTDVVLHEDGEYAVVKDGKLKFIRG